MFKPGPQYSVLIRRSIGRGARNVFREQNWFTSFGALFGVLLMLQMLLFSIAGSQTLAEILQTRTDIKVEVIAGASDQETQEFFTQVQNLSIVEQAVYITKEQALESARTNDPALIEFLDKYNMDNPFPDTVGVTLHKFEGVKELAAFIQQERWSKVVNPARLTELAEQEGQITELLTIISTGQTLAYLILIVAIVVLIFVVTELIRQRIAVRRDEVFIENLVGADPSTVTLPFIVEATIMLWVAATLSLAVVILILYAMPMFSQAFHGDLAQILNQPFALYLKKFIPTIVLAEGLGAPVMAWIGAWLGVRPQLKNSRLGI